MKKKCPLEGDVAPTRERRVGAIRAYLGTAKQLLKDAKGGRLESRDFAFTNAWTCSAMGHASPLRYVTVTDSVVIVHSPVGCISQLTQFVAPLMQPKWEFEGFGGFKPSQPANWYCSNITEEEVIFGAERKLKETIIMADQKHHPKCIWIFTSCASGIMGDDIGGVVKEVQPGVGAIIVPIHCEAFRSRLSQWGHDATAHAILKYLVRKPEKKRNNMINIGSPVMVWWTNRRYLTSLLARVGIECNYVPDYSTTENFQILSEAAASVHLCRTWSSYLFEGLEQEYGVPYILQDTEPFGIARTELWLRKLAQVVGTEEEMEKVIEEERAAVMPRVEALREQLQGLRVFISGGQMRTYHVPHILVDDFGMELVGINPYEFDDGSIPELENLLRLTGNKDFMVDVSDNQTLQMANYLRKLDVDLFLGERGTVGYIFKHSTPGMRVGCTFGEYHSLRADMDVGMQMGFKGVASYGEYLLRVVRNPSLHNKLSAHTKLPFKDSWYEQDPAVNLVKPIS